MANVDDQPMLTTLPNELLATIAENLDRGDLLSLRLVNREVSAAIDAPFVTRFFSRRTHLYTQHSLQALLDISSIPRSAAKLHTVQLVVVALTGLDRGEFPPEPRDPGLIEHFDIFGEGGMHLIETTVPTKEEHEDHERVREETRQQIQVRDVTWTIWTEQRERLHSDAKDVELLSRAFRNLGSGNRSVGVCVFDHLYGQVEKDASGRYAHVGTYGVRQLRQLLGPVVEREDLVSNPCDNEGHSVLSALSRSKLRVGEIDMCSQSWEAGIGPAAFNVNGAVFDDLLICFAHLTTLKIGFCGYPREEGWVSSQNGRFLAVVKAAVSLQSLGIGSRDRYEVDAGWPAEKLFGLVVNAVTSRQLRSVAVHNMRFRGQQLVKFLQAHSGTLKALKFLGLGIPDYECWGTVIRCILEELHLDTLCLGHLQRGELETSRVLMGACPSTDGAEQQHDDFLWLGRKQEVKEGLKEFWETAEYR